MAIIDEIRTLREEYRLRRAYFEQDGILEDFERQQLDELAEEINELEDVYSRQAQISNNTTSTTEAKTQPVSEEPETEEPETYDEMSIPVTENVGVNISSDTDGNMSIGVSVEKDGTSGGVSVSTSGEVTVSIGHETEGEDGKTSFGLEVSSEGDFTASAEHEFTNEVTASAEITNESITLALGRTWDMPEVNSWIYLLPPSPATFGLGVVLSARLNGSAGIEAKEEINFIEGTSSIGISTTGSLSGTVQVTGEALGIIQAGGNSRLTSTVTGSGELVFDGSNISPNASITSNLVLSFNVLIGLSESIISAARAFDVSRDDLTFEYPISSLELLKVVGVRIENGRITGTPSFEPGKDLETVKSAINSGVERIKEVWDTIKHYFDEAGNLISEAAEAAGEVYDNAVDATADAIESTVNAVENTANAVGELHERAVDATADAIESTVNAASDTLDDIGEGINNLREKIKNIDLNPFD